MDLTPQQEQAITTLDRNLIVVAGAGSGKTHVLVERYLYLLAANPNWPLNALVAITFTEAAAMEMRDRVRARLAAKLRDDPANAARWSYLLAQMDSARISTIHSLCSDILRANAAQAALDPAFAVLDAVEAALLLDACVDDVLQALSADDPHDLLLLFQVYNERDVRAVLTDAGMIGAALPQLPDDLYAAWEARYQEQIRAALQRLAQDDAFQDALHWQPLAGWPQGDKLYAMWQAVHDVQDDLLQTDDTQRALDAMQHLSATIKLNVGSAKNWGDKDELGASKAALRAIRDTCRDVLKASERDPGAELRAAEILPRWHKLIERVQYAYQQAKHDDSLLDFDDLEGHTAHLLATNADVASRYARNEFRHLLVDEFQDTNARQWQIIKALSGLHTQPARASQDKMQGTLFVVGDPKQSIYGFRGADVSVFGDVRREITSRAGVAVPLATSFRSHPGLINAFNALFGHILTRDEASPVAAYQVTLDAADEMDALRDDTPDLLPETAHIEVMLLDENSKTGVMRDGKAATINADERRQWEAAEIAERLQRMYQQGAQVHDKKQGCYRAFSYNDAAVLFRASTRIPAYEAVFKALDLPFVTIAGRGYYDRQEVWDVLNLLRALHNPTDNLSLAAALRSPMFGFSDDLLLALRLLKASDEDRDPLPLWDALAENQHEMLAERVGADDLGRVQFAYQTLQQLQRIAGRVTIAELLRQVYAYTGYPAILTGLSGGDRRRRNLEKLIDIADTSGRITLSAFSAYIDDLSEREVREGEALLEAEGAIKLMTVHASKGLEFPMVVLADASWERKNNESAAFLHDEGFGMACKLYDEASGEIVKPFMYTLLADLRAQREAAESKRLLYVAATRARDYLLLCGGAKADKNGLWASKGWLDQVLDALEVRDIDGDTLLDHYAEQARIRISLPKYDPALPQSLQSSEKPPDFSSTGDHAPYEPPLLAPVLQAASEQIGHLTATQLAELGRRRYEKQGPGVALQQAVLNNAPTRVRPIDQTRNPRITSRLVGEVVHEALRYWQLPHTVDNIRDVLQGYAWAHNITQQADQNEVVQQALGLLKRFQGSLLYNRISTARDKNLPVYTEMPFVYRTEKRILHGVIDTVFQDESGRWCIVDYKTGYIDTSEQHITEAAAQHARRYHLQVGAYAAALMQQLGGAVPDVTIHYIGYNQSVSIPADVWQAALDALESMIGDIVGG
jgi:ATP-dependent helicase/nuclease subunit A